MVTLTAPANPGRLYRSRWQLRDPDGMPFGFLFEESPSSRLDRRNQHTPVHHDLCRRPHHPRRHAIVAGSSFTSSGASATQDRQWGSGFRLNYIEGDRNMARGNVSHMVPEAKPGEEVILSHPDDRTARPQWPTNRLQQFVAHARRSRQYLWRPDHGAYRLHPGQMRHNAQDTALSRLLNHAHSGTRKQSAPGKGSPRHGQTPIATWGCLMTCMAMAMSAFGSRVTPAELNQKLKTIGDQGFIDSDVRFRGPQNVGGPRFGGNAPSWEKDSNSNQPWTGENPIQRIDNALAQGNIVVAQVDTNPNNTVVDQHWVILLKRTQDGADYQMLDPLTPQQHLGRQPKSLMDKYGERVPSQSNETNLRNAIKSSIIYHKPGGSGG